MLHSNFFLFRLNNIWILISSEFLRYMIFKFYVNLKWLDVERIYLSYSARLSDEKFSFTKGFRSSDNYKIWNVDFALWSSGWISRRKNDSRFRKVDFRSLIRWHLLLWTAFVQIVFAWKCQIKAAFFSTQNNSRFSSFAENNIFSFSENTFSAFSVTINNVFDVLSNK